MVSGKHYMYLKLRNVVAGLLCVAMFMTACSQGGPSGGETATRTPGQSTTSISGGGQKVVIKLAHQVAEQAALHKGAIKFKEIVEKESGGTIEVQVFPNGQLGSEKDMIEGVKLGTIQMAIPSAAALAQFFPPVGVFAMPYLWNGTTETEEYQNMIKVVRGPIGQELQQQAAQQTGILPLDFGWWYGDRHITNRVRPVHKPEDLVGLKIRTPDAPINVAPIKAMGATVVPMAFSEVYTALKTGTVDGQENPIAIIYAQKFYEPQKYLSLTGHMTQNQVPIINAGFFERLIPEHQELLRRAIVEAGDYQSKIQIEDNTSALEAMKQKGIRVNTVDKDLFRAAIAEQVLEQFKDQFAIELYQRVRQAQEE